MAKVRLACHPHDPAYPPGGLNGVHHVLGSLDGLRRGLAQTVEWFSRPENLAVYKADIYNI